MLLLVFGWFRPQANLPSTIYGLERSFAGFLTLLNRQTRNQIVLVVPSLLVMLVLFSLSGNIRQRDPPDNGGILGPLGLSVIAMHHSFSELLLDITRILLAH